MLCGHEWHITPGNLINGRGCPECAKKSRVKKLKKSHRAFIDEMRMVNSNIKIIGKYEQAHKKIRCLCMIHNEEFMSAPTHLLQDKTGCSQCIDLKNHLSGLKTHEQYLEDLNKINKDIEVLGKYVGAQHPIEVRCKKCGYQWSRNATEFLTGVGCPYCYQSKGERAISIWLNEHGIAYEEQKKFDGLFGMGGRKLSYDFYIPSHKLLIEYQGKFHDGTASMDKETYYEKQVEHDKRKKEYASSNGYDLLEIWYYDYKDIDSILSNNLRQNPVTITA